MVWLGALSLFIFRAYHTYRQLTSNIDQGDFAQILKKLKANLHLVDQSLATTQDDLEKLKQRTQTHLQKIGFVRYNPFGNTGGDQSFCICLLDGKDNGILITSLHTREQTRLYTKEILQGEPKEAIKLSKEEVLCLKKAKSWGTL